MTGLPSMTTIGGVPDSARGLVRDLRPRWAFGEVEWPSMSSSLAMPGRRGHRAVGEIND
jgi:hypothetical protein